MTEPEIETESEINRERKHEALFRPNAHMPGVRQTRQMGPWGEPVGSL